MKPYLLLLAALLAITPAAAPAADPCALAVLNPVESVLLLGDFQLRVNARVDTGADLSSLDSTLAQQAGLDQPVVREITVRNANGVTRRKVVRLKFMLRGQVRQAEFSLIKRDGLAHPVLLGRRTLQGFLVDPSGKCEGC
ncbi:MAG TPA: RimK/LysX family protein [Candidatus Obscuribacterales bacterium]